jgi:type IV pilus assembly protein PilM
MASFFSFLFPKKQHSVLGVDIGTSAIKIVQLKSKDGKAVLETYGELGLAPAGGGEVGQAKHLAPQQIAENLKDLMREAKVTTTRAGVAIPFNRSLLSVVTLPKRPEEEMKTMIPIEARKYIPVSIEEVQLDWFIIPPRHEENTDKVEVLIVAVHKDALSELDGAVTAAGLTPSFYEIEIFSTVRAVVDEPTKPVMVIDVGASATNMYVVERGIVVMSHSMPKGGQDATQALAASSSVSFGEAETWKKKIGFTSTGAPEKYHPRQLEITYSGIFAEARRVLVSFESETKRSIARIVLTGGGSVIRSIEEIAKSVFTTPLSTADPFSKVEAPAFMSPILKDIGPEFSVALGLALRQLEDTPS